MAHTRLLGRVALGSLAIALTLAAAGCGNQHTGPGYANGSSGGLTYAARGAQQGPGHARRVRSRHEGGKCASQCPMTRKMRKGTRCRAEGDRCTRSPAREATMSMYMPHRASGTSMRDGGRPLLHAGARDHAALGGSSPSTPGTSRRRWRRLRRQRRPDGPGVGLRNRRRRCRGPSASASRRWTG